VTRAISACECGAEEQTVDHVVLECPIHRPPYGLHGLTVLDDETVEWLLNTCPETQKINLATFIRSILQTLVTRPPKIFCAGAPKLLRTPLVLLPVERNCM